MIKHSSLSTGEKKTCSWYLLPPDGQSSKHRSELSLSRYTGVMGAEEFPRQQTTKKHKKGWTHRRMMECFTQMENKCVRNWEKVHLHWSGLFSQFIPSYLKLLFKLKILLKLHYARGIKLKTAFLMWLHGEFLSEIFYLFFLYYKKTPMNNPQNSKYRTMGLRSRGEHIHTSYVCMQQYAALAKAPKTPALPFNIS